MKLACLAVGLFLMGVAPALAANVDVQMLNKGNDGAWCSSRPWSRSRSETR